MSEKTPNYTIRVDGTAIEYRCAADDTVLSAGLRSSLGIPYECNSGVCGSCRFTVLDGDVDDLWPEATGLNDRDRRRGRKLACKSRPVSDLVVAVRPDDRYVPEVVPARQPVTLVERRLLTRDITEFSFRSDGAPARFLPGQFALLDLPGVTGTRAYSMSNLPNAGGSWEFQIKFVPGGAASEALFERLEPGARITLDGPFGLAYLRRDSARDIIGIAGGSGLSPICSIARANADAKDGRRRPFLFFHGVRQPADVCGDALLCDLPGYGVDLRYIPAISEPEDGDGWGGETGFIHEVVARHLPADLSNVDFYIAGPPQMVAATQRLLMTDGRVPGDRIYRDSFS